MDKLKVRTSEPSSWCAGCLNFMILAGVQKFFEEQLAAGKKKEDFAIVSGIGCHAKIFDYLDMPGMNTLHGRVPPTCLGLKMARPKMTVFGFSGDGDAYAEGLEHTLHAARYNSDFKYIVHNNQVFALTLGEPTPVAEVGYKDKSVPGGNLLIPLNPIKLMLAGGASFVARVFADIGQVKYIIEEASKHKGFAFIEIIQPCLTFHNDSGYKERMYNLQEAGHNVSDWNAAMQKALEFDYTSTDSKIPIGIFFKQERKTFEELKGKA
jgi:2-oxoglutarate ferredoxin oxidoreductase subunit beta